jgi:[ribosomal protein S18]-alanine N-acetyltransferase
MTRLQRRVRPAPPGGDMVTFEVMRRRHLRRVLAIEEQVYPRPWTPGVFSSEMAQARAGHRYYTVALRAGNVVGYGGIMVTDDGAHVTNIAVDPLCHRQGIGRLLLVHLMRRAIDQGCDAMTLEVRITNTAAQALYRSFGFAPAGIRHRYYENTDDALVMWCHDLQGDEVARRLAGGVDDKEWS